MELENRSKSTGKPLSLVERENNFAGPSMKKSTNEKVFACASGRQTPN